MSKRNNRNKDDRKKDVIFYALMAFVVILFGTLMFKEWGIIPNNTGTSLVTFASMLLTFLLLAIKIAAPNDTITEGILTIIKALKGGE